MIEVLLSTKIPKILDKKKYQNKYLIINRALILTNFLIIFLWPKKTLPKQ